MPILGSESLDRAFEERALAAAEAKEERDGKLIPINIHTASVAADVEENPTLRILKCENALIQIITADVLLNPKERANRIQSLARGSIPVQEIESAYSIAKTAVRKANSRMNSYVGRVTYHNGSNNITADVDDGLSQSEKELAILNWEI
jgi:hypothetical protein